MSLGRSALPGSKDAQWLGEHVTEELRISSRRGLIKVFLRLRAVCLLGFLALSAVAGVLANSEFWPSAISRAWI